MVCSSPWCRDRNLLRYIDYRESKSALPIMPLSGLILNAVTYCNCHTVLSFICLKEGLAVCIWHIQSERFFPYHYRGATMLEHWMLTITFPPSRYDALLQEKEEVEEAFESFKQDVMLTREGNASKEIRVLKKVIKNLEVSDYQSCCTHQLLLSDLFFIFERVWEPVNGPWGRWEIFTSENLATRYHYVWMKSYLNHLLL